MDLAPAVTRTIYILLKSVFPGKSILVEIIMSYLRTGGSWPHHPPAVVLRTTLYVLAVHARMFNEIEFVNSVRLEAVIQRFPSLDRWADNAARHGVWRTHPMVARA